MKNDDSFILTCKYGHSAGIHPFETDITETEFYNHLRSHALKFELNIFWSFLMESQYYIDLWAARFILQDFKPNQTANPSGWPGRLSLIDDCIDTVESYTKVFNLGQRENFDIWIKTVKAYYSLS